MQKPEPYFQPGEHCGRYAIVSFGAHGLNVQRYRAHDPTADRPVLITCAKRDPEQWKARFEELAKKRAGFQSTPSMLDWGVTPSGIFFIVEDDLDAQPMTSFSLRSSETPSKKALLASVVPAFALLYSIAKQFAEFARDGFWHGAIDPIETCKLHEGAPLLTGIGFVQILGYTHGPELEEGTCLAPELRAGQAWDERADVFSVCKLILDMIRGEQSEADALAALDTLARPFVFALNVNPAKRPTWKALLGWVGSVLERLLRAGGARSQTIAAFLGPASEGAEEEKAPTTYPKSPRTDALVREEFLNTYRALIADTMEPKPHDILIWKAYPRPQARKPIMTIDECPHAFAERVQPRNTPPAIEPMPNMPRTSIEIPPSAERITPAPFAHGRAWRMPAESVATKAPAPVNAAESARSTRPMDSIEAEPSTLRSLPFRNRRESWRSIGLGLLATMFALTAFLGLFLVFRAEPARLEALQWPLMPSVPARESAQAPQPLIPPGPSPIAERKTETAPTRRAAREKWSFCNVVHCAPRGQVPDE